MAELQFKEARKRRISLQTIRTFIFLFLAYVILCIFVNIFPYEYRDSDSSAYSSIGQKLARQPLTKWCAPQWWGHGFHAGLFQDHPPGVLWINALFVRIGIPGSRAALCANFLYIFVSLYFIYLLVSHFGRPYLGWGAVFAYAFSPIFIQYLVRANHEHPLNLAVIAGLYGLARSEESCKYKAIFVMSLIFAAMIKGLSALVLSLSAFILWLVLLRNRRSLLFILIAHLFALGAMFLFELWYRQITGGISFWQNYIAFQLGKATEAGFNPLRKIYNLVWYAGRAVWFPAPWVFFIIYGLFKMIKANIQLFKDKFSVLCLTCSSSIILWFSLFDRKADRYIFPAYTFLILAGVWILFHLKPSLTQWLQKKEKLLPAYLSSLLVILTAARLFFHSKLYVFIRLWPE